MSVKYVFESVVVADYGHLIACEPNCGAPRLERDLQRVSKRDFHRFSSIFQRMKPGKGVLP